MFEKAMELAASAADVPHIVYRFKAMKSGEVPLYPVISS